MAEAVAFANVSKRFRRGIGSFGNLRDVLGHVMKRGRAEAAQRSFLALDDLSFAIEEGESFALIGPNGAGKTTALKLMTRVSRPTTGEIRVRGRVGALIEVGSGIHPELTGRENIMLNGRLLGIPRAEIRRRFDEIVAFSELEHVLDTPAKRFSSGMQLRLGFSIAAHVDPDIFVVDEALSVGDAVFQARCVERMTSFVEEGRTVILVSHNLADIERLCARGIFLHKGQVMAEGDSRAVLASYLDWVEEERLRPQSGGPEEGVLEVVDVSVRDLEGRERTVFAPRDGVQIRMRFRGPEVERPHVTIGITDGRPDALIGISMLIDGEAPERVGPGEWTISCQIDELRLQPRLYQIWGEVWGADGASRLTPWRDWGTFRVEEEVDVGANALIGRRVAGAVAVDYRWIVERAPGSDDDASA
jgi:homopolymeric O-antigen transport system ATP-binding protein